LKWLKKETMIDKGQKVKVETEMEEKLANETISGICFQICKEKCQKKRKTM
jgi:hypothetical protein